jgi:hypothetical protein
MSDADVSHEVDRLHAALLLEVPDHTIGNADGARAWIGRAKWGGRHRRAAFACRQR